MPVICARGVPTWIPTLAQRCMEVLGLTAWEVRIELAEMSEPDRQGEVQRHPFIRRAEIYFTRAIRNDRNGRITVCHEIAHLAGADVDFYVDEIITIFVKGKSAKRFVGQAYSNLIEPQTEIIARLLERVTRSK